jgi:Zn-finger nucleic acid-binding protein
MNCPDCYTPMKPAGNRPHLICRHCNQFYFSADTGDGVNVFGESAGAACPVCRVSLKSAEIEDETVCYCERCRGFLAPLDAFCRIVSRRRSRQPAPENCSDPFDALDLQRVLTCPNCQQHMEAHPYFGGGNAVVDTCEGCQLIWLDAGELNLIGRYTRHAGPDVSVARSLT